MLKPIGFWSYSTTDDDHSRGRLSQLRALLSSELQQKIGRNLKVNIFQDVAAIPPGAEWEKQIQDAIDGSSFLIPIITPSLLQSQWCCQEISLFRRREATTLRCTDLIFPLHYVGVDDLDPSKFEDCHDPEIFRFLRSRQWLDFRTLRHKNPESEDVARRIESMADAIYSALRHAGRDNLDEQKSRKIETAQAKDKARVVEDLRQREADVEDETARKRSETEAERGQDEGIKRTMDALSNESRNEKRHQHEAAAAQERGQTAQQQFNQKRQHGRSKEKGPFENAVRGIQSSLDLRSWSYFKIAVITALLGLIANCLGQFDILYGLTLGGTEFLAPFRGLYAATVSLLATRLTASPIQRFAVLFFGTYVIDFVERYTLHAILPAESETVLLVVMVVLVLLVSKLIQWLFVAKAVSLLKGFRDRKSLIVMVIAFSACGLVEAITHESLLGPLLQGFVGFAVDFSATALLFTYGIRNNKPMPLNRLS